MPRMPSAVEHDQAAVRRLRDEIIASGGGAAQGIGTGPIVVLSSSLLVDRMLVHSAFLSSLNARASVDVWATSARNPNFRALWKSQPARVSEFPDVRPFRQLRHNYLRRLNEAVWDYRQRDPSRLSILRHRRRSRHGIEPAIEAFGRLLATMPIEEALEKWLERWLLRYERCPQANRFFWKHPNALLVCTGPFQFEQPAVVAAAKRAGVHTMALIPSWDNISTKRRMLFKYDGYLVWSEPMRRELQARYPQARSRPVYVVGAPQFDVFFQPRFHLSREAFCGAQGLRPNRPIIVYALGSPNFLRGEPYGALQMARAVIAGDLGDVQMLVRPHPIHDNAELDRLFHEFSPLVRVQRTAAAGTPLTARSQDEAHIKEWVNTFRHADVVVNLSSTVTVDAAICDRPVVNLDFDPGPHGEDHELVKEINHVWTHFKLVAESGGVWLVSSFDEMLKAVRTYLAHPELHRAQRRWIAQYVCEHLDGRCGERMAEAVLDFARGTGPEGHA
jgi:hypothetical protein